MRDIWYGTAGSRAPKVIFVGEAWGREEEAAGSPFIGQSGKELFRLLGECKAFRFPSLHAQALGATTFKQWIELRDAWLLANQILFTNVVADRPPGNELWRFFHENAKGDKSLRVKGLRPTSHVVSEVLRLRLQLAETSPMLVAAVGNYAMWALTESCSVSSVPTGNGATVSVPGGITLWRGALLLSAQFTASPLPGLPRIYPAPEIREWYVRQHTPPRLPQSLPPHSA